MDLLFLLGGCWQEPVRFAPGAKMEAGETMDHRLRDLAGALAAGGPPNMEHLAILTRWHGSSWRDGEWLGFDSVDKIPYRKMVNAIGRVLGGGHVDTNVDAPRLEARATTTTSIKKKDGD